MQDSIEKVIDLKAPVSRVWQAVTDYKEFGAWFQADLENPFVVGEVTRGVATYRGAEGVKWVATVEAMEPERLFSFRWCPYANDNEMDYSKEPTTLVEFRFEPTATGTRLVVTESGFSQLPDEAKATEALRRNTGGWNAQAGHITAYVES